MTGTSFALLLGGSLTPTPRLSEAVGGCRVIAADGGMRHASALGLRPELWVGDFDSVSPEVLEAWPDVERQPYPQKKALTDGEIAVGEALERGARRLVLVGALRGERSDHALQHHVLALGLAARGIDAMLTSGDEEAWPIVPGKHRLDLPPGSLFSLIGFSALEGLSIDGARYPLDKFDLPFGSSRTLSNVAEGPIRLTLRAGIALLLARPYDLTGA